MDIKVNDYVRTKHYGIFKVLNVEKDGKTIFFKKAQGVDVIVADKYNKIEDEIIGEPKEEIIDLIEVGDYVNGHKVYEIKKNCILVGYKCFVTKINDEEEFLYQSIYEADIKSILTKEMFEQMEYKIN